MFGLDIITWKEGELQFGPALGEKREDENITEKHLRVGVQSGEADVVGK